MKLPFTFNFIVYEKLSSDVSTTFCGALFSVKLEVIFGKAARLKWRMRLKILLYTQLFYVYLLFARTCLTWTNSISYNPSLAQTFDDANK
jgi:hypothetical protein